MKYIHVVSKKMTRNGPKRVIVKSTMIFYGTDVSCYFPASVLNKYYIRFGLFLAALPSTSLSSTFGMWLLSIPSLIFLKFKECLWLVCHMRDQIRAWIPEALCRRSLLPTTRQKLSLVATWRSKEKEYLMHADNCAAVRCIQQKPTKLNIY